MVFKQKRQIFLNRLLLPAILLTLVTGATPESNKQPILEGAEILRRITLAEDEVGYVGKRISISWVGNRSLAREMLVVHQPPSTHWVKLLSPQGDSRRPPMSREERWNRGQNRDRGSRGKDFRPEPRDRRRFEERSFFPRPPQRVRWRLDKENIELLSQNYNLRYVPSDKVAGYETNLLTIEPRFEGRPMKRLWIAKDKGIILRLEDLDFDGNLRGMSVYTQISFDPEQIQQKITEFQSSLGDEKTKSSQGERTLRSPSTRIRGIERVSLPEAEKAFGRQLVQPDYLPQGFRLQDMTLIKFGSDPAIHLRYTDGLMVFSLFESKGASGGGLFKPKEKRPPEPPNRGGFKGQEVQTQQLYNTSVQIIDNWQTHILRWFQGDIGFTLIGELSRNEMIKIAESLIRDSAQ